MSGNSSWFSGWFNILFPFINDYVNGIHNQYNRFCVPYDTDFEYVQCGLTGSITVGNQQINYPMGLSAASGICGDGCEFRVIAGFCGFKQDNVTLEICPNLGLGVALKEDNNNDGLMMNNDNDNVMMNNNVTYFNNERNPLMMN